MKILVTVLITALFVFALATTWVDFVQPHLAQSQPVADKTVVVPEPPLVKKRVRRPVETDDELLPVPTEHVSPPSRRTAEAAAEIARRLEDVKQQETTLAAREEALRMIYDDIRSELANVDDLRRRTSQELIEAETRVQVTAQRRVPALSKSASPPVRGASKITSSTAFLLRRLVQDGHTETAISMLKGMKGYEAATVLEVLEASDPRIAERLAEGAASTAFR
ncbi:MAG: hypothetical protein JSS49_03300 [Planctomycetes bacterium]|nr:hypothetical protein [Planctomycetota bacterium]